MRYVFLILITLCGCKVTENSNPYIFESVRTETVYGPFLIDGADILDHHYLNTDSVCIAGQPINGYWCNDSIFCSTEGMFRVLLLDNKSKLAVEINGRVNQQYYFTKPIKR